MAQGVSTRSVPYLWQRRSFREGVRATILYTLLVGIGVLVLMPLSWMLTAALRGPGEIVFTIPTSWFPTESFHFENFWTIMTYPAYPFWRPVANTLQLVLLNVVGVVLSNTLVAFAFARLRFPGREFLFRLIILTMLMPGVVLMVPSFLLFHRLGWYGTYLPLWVPSFFAGAWSVFITRQYMRTFPQELDDAAYIDGCGYFGLYWRIILPLCKPVLTVLAVFTFQGVWNDFTGPLIYLDETREYTLAIALEYFRRATFSSVTIDTTNMVMAAALLSVVPLLAVFFAVQEQLIGGIASVGLKG
jgi:multiple sugar transport system permease protein